ncbi:MAG TPA: aroma-sacti cluster domain-containing protein [Blastocatellia bacterium]|nr:aroma-sacti cluster domain-containing protein [Blastocatellia bacterium]
MSNREKLEEAGLLGPGVSLTPEQEEAIECLNDEEVSTLINVKKKLGKAFADRGEREMGVIM